VNAIQIFAELRPKSKGYFSLQPRSLMVFRHIDIEMKIKGCLPVISSFAALKYSCGCIIA